MSKSTSKALAAAKGAQTKQVNGVVTRSGAARHGAVMRMESGLGIASMVQAEVGSKEHAGNAAGLGRVMAASAGMTKEQTSALAALARSNAKAGGGVLAIDGTGSLAIG